MSENCLKPTCSWICKSVGWVTPLLFIRLNPHHLKCSMCHARAPTRPFFSKELPPLLQMSQDMCKNEILLVFQKGHT